MIKLEKTEVVGWEATVRGMRNPLNSWARSDSGHSFGDDISDLKFVLGHNDADLAERLINAGSDHAKFLRMVTVYVDITAPLYWWKEFDTYKVGTVANSCSTMHKIHDKRFEVDDFSHEHLDAFSLAVLMEVIDQLNKAREDYCASKDKVEWWQMIQLLPSSYNQKRTVMLNYEVLRRIYYSRKDHKLDEWHTFCDWIRTLPYAYLITK